MLIYVINSGLAFQIRYTDTHPLATSRQISIKSSPLSLILSTSSNKSLLFHLIDTPGHVNFIDEVASAMRLVDGVVVVVDVIEGVSTYLCYVNSLFHTQKFMNRL